MEHVSMPSNGIFRRYQNSGRRHHCRERNQKKLHNMQTGKTNYAVMGYIQMRNYSEMKKKRGLRGDPHRMGGSGDSRKLCTNPPQDTNPKKHHPSSRRRKSSIPPKIPEWGPIQPGKLENEIRPTIDKHRNLPMRGKIMRTTSCSPKSRIGKLQINGQESKKHMASYDRNGNKSPIPPASSPGTARLAAREGRNFPFPGNIPGNSPGNSPGTPREGC